MSKNVKDAAKVVVGVIGEVGKDLLIYAAVGSAVLKAAKEISKARDYFDKK
jgi:hypothetical protein